MLRRRSCVGTATSVAILLPPPFVGLLIDRCLGKSTIDATSLQVLLVFFLCSLFACLSCSFTCDGCAGRARKRRRRGAKTSRRCERADFLARGKVAIRGVKEKAKKGRRRGEQLVDLRRRRRRQKKLCQGRKRAASTHQSSARRFRAEDDGRLSFFWGGWSWGEVRYQARGRRRIRMWDRSIKGGVATQDRCSLKDMHEFTNVAGPAVRQKFLESIRGELFPRRAPGEPV